MQKVVLELDIHDNLDCKKKAMKVVSSVPGLESISMDMKEKKLTVVGDVDPVALVKKMRKNFYTQIVSIGPAKEPEKKKEEPKAVVQVTDYVHAYNSYNYPAYPRYISYARTVEEDPNGCVIC